MTTVPIHVVPAMILIISAGRQSRILDICRLWTTREGEKCRPLDHVWQTPFIQSTVFVLAINLKYIHRTVPVISAMWYVQVCLGSVWIWPLCMCCWRNTHLMAQSHHEAIVSFIRYLLVCIVTTKVLHLGMRISLFQSPSSALKKA